MGLISTIEAGIDTAFNAVGDIATSVTLHRKVRNDFDTNVLRPIVADESPDIVIDKVLVTSFTIKELKDRGILPTDQKVLIKGVDLSIIPIPEDDRLTINGKVWQIKRVQALPQNVLFILQVRAIE